MQLHGSFLSLLPFSLVLAVEALSGTITLVDCILLCVTFGSESAKLKAT